LIALIAKARVFDCQSIGNRSTTHVLA
jgi:hypothetical protein